MTFHSLPPTRLLSMRDEHGAPLADFDWYPALELLQVSWHGHLTADSLVRGAQMGLNLPAFAGQNGPRYLLTNHEQASGSWEEALPWLQYDWLPQALGLGLRRLAHIVSPDPASRLTQPDQFEFVRALQQSLRGKAFRRLPTAWHWLTRH